MWLACPNETASLSPMAREASDTAIAEQRQNSERKDGRR